MKLTEHFTLEEMTFSETGIRKGLDNTPDDEAKKNLKVLCMNVLEKIRIKFSLPVRINSGFRSLAVNKAVGGVKNSQHLKGEAADTVLVGMPVKKYYREIKNMVNGGELVIDQCILEYDTWVHLSFNKEFNRNQFLIKEVGKPYELDE